MEALVFKNDDFNIALSESVKLVRRSNRESQNEEHLTLHSLISTGNELKQRIAPSFELQVRMVLDITQTKGWGNALEIFGLKDIFEFVANGLKFEGMEVENGRIRMYRSLMIDYTGRGYNDDKIPPVDIDSGNVLPLLRLSNKSVVPLGQDSILD